MNGANWKICKAAAIGVCVLAVLFVCSYHERRIPQDILIPQGFVGRVRIDYSVPGAQPLKLVDQLMGNRYEVSIPESGTLATSTSFGKGMAVDKFFEVDKSSRRTEMQQDISGTGTGREIRGERDYGTVCGADQHQRVFRVFFVGNAIEYSKVKDREFTISGADCSPGSSAAGVPVMK